jgi:hypothetical protein
LGLGIFIFIFLQFLYIVCGQNSPPIKLLLLPQVLFRFSPSKIKLWLVVLWFGLALESTFHSIPFQLLVLLTPRFVINNCGKWCALDSEDYAVEERDLVIDFSLEFLVVRIARTVIDCKSAEAKSLGACIAQLPKIADEEERA